MDKITGNGIGYRFDDPRLEFKNTHVNAVDDEGRFLGQCALESAKASFSSSHRRFKSHSNTFNESGDQRLICFDNLASQAFDAC